MATHALITPATVTVQDWGLTLNHDPERSRNRHKRWVAAARVLVAVATVAALAACTGDSGTLAPAATGLLTVVVNVDGNGTDADGFSVSLDSRSVTVQPNVLTTLGAVPPGTYALRLTGLAPQCSAGADTASATVVAGDTASVRFVVACYGGVAFVEALAPDNWQVFYLAEDGRLVQLTTGPGRNFLEDWSPDGTRVVFETDRNGNVDLYTVRIDGTDLRRLTANLYQDLQPRWSPDGQSIVFHRTPNQSGPFERASLHVVSADGTSERLLLDTLRRDFDPTWTPNGSTVVFSCDRFGNLWDLCAVAPDGTGLRRIRFSNGAQHSDASPDGRHVGFQSFDGGQAIWVASLDGTSVTSLTPGLVSYDFGWSPDGTQLVLGTYDGEFRIQRVNRDGTGLSALTAGTDAAGDGRWSPDGARIAFYSLRGGQQVWVMKPDGTDMHPITSGPGPKFHPRWNPQAQPGRINSHAAKDPPLAGAARLVPPASAIAGLRGRSSAYPSCIHAPGQTVYGVPCRP